MTTRSEMPMDPFRAFIGAEAGEGWRNSMYQQLERFWEAQGKLLDEYQSVTRSMLDRRRAAAESLRDTLHKMSGCSGGADWAKCYTDWLSGSLSRMAEDSRDLVQGGLKVMSEMSQSVTAGVAEATRAAGEAQQAAARETAAAAAADPGSAMAQEAARAARVQPKQRRPEEASRPAAE